MEYLNRKKKHNINIEATLFAFESRAKANTASQKITATMDLVDVWFKAGFERTEHLKEQEKLDQETWGKGSKWRKG